MWLLVSTLMAAEPPPRPPPTPHVEGQCIRAIAMRVGSQSDCRGILLPTSWMADYEKLGVHATRVEDLYRIDTGALEFKLQYTQTLLEEARRPVPLTERPLLWAGLGVVIGGAAVVFGGYAISGAAK
tara:strand:- start:1067 stop:1447 length:381 start_codon:yes stop_codon:yes gene_type:complete